MTRRTAFESFTAYADEKAKEREEAADVTFAAIKRAQKNTARRGNSLVVCPGKVRVLPHAGGAVVTLDASMTQLEADQILEASDAGKLWIVAEVAP
ncbi:MAG TPA: hypothetical protein PLN64_01665 [Candidatus Bipolaricaulis anaerobius]|nr:hypothetical protein [Candidatus Bipolaricaulis anaerobius]